MRYFYSLPESPFYWKQNTKHDVSVWTSCCKTLHSWSARHRLHQPRQSAPDIMTAKLSPHTAQLTWISSEVSFSPRFDITRPSSCLLMNPFPSWIKNTKPRPLLFKRYYPVKHLKCFSYLVLGILSVNPERHHQQELGEIDASSAVFIHLIDHILRKYLYLECESLFT